MVVQDHHRPTDSILERTYNLIQYCRSKFDTTPIPSSLANSLGHVDDDKYFLQQKEDLFKDIQRLLTRDGSSLEYEKFYSKIERGPHVIPPGQFPAWKGMIRCRCWWDAKDELQHVADYFENIKEAEVNRLREIKTRRSKQVAAALVTALGLTIGIFTNVATNIIPSSIQPYTSLAWPIVILLGLVVVVVSYRSS